MKNNRGSVAGYVLGFVGFGLIAYFILIAPFVGLHIKTSEGTHVGFITATEKSGLFFKTGTAYVKTDTQSSQEDSYCVTDDAVLAQLKDASIKKNKVEVGYIGYYSAGIANCAWEGAVITSVKDLQ